MLIEQVEKTVKFKQNELGLLHLTIKYLDRFQPYWTLNVLATGPDKQAPSFVYSRTRHQQIKNNSEALVVCPT